MKNLWVLFFFLAKSLFADAIYILNNGGDTVSVYDSSTFAFLAGPFSTTGAAGQYMVINPSGNMLYVANNASNDVSFIDASASPNLTVFGNFSTMGTNPMGIAVNPAGTLVYVTNNGSNTVIALDAANGSVVAGPTLTGGMQPNKIVVNPSGTRIYLCNDNSGTVAVHDAATLAPIMGSPFPVAVLGIRGIALNPAGTLLYVTGSGSNDVAVLDATTLMPIAGSPFPVGGTSPQGVVLNPADTYVCLTNITSTDVSVLDATSPIYAPIAGSPFSTGMMGATPENPAIDPTGTYLFVCNVGDSNVVIFDINNNFMTNPASPLTMNISGPIAVAFGPLASTFPNPPQNLRGSRQASNDFGILYALSNRLTWEASTSNPAGYFIYRGGVKIASVGPATLQYIDSNGPKGLAAYSVTAFDANGNESAPISVIVN